MTVLDTLARADCEAPVERLLCHPRLPLVAGLDSGRPAAHVWGSADGELRPLGTVTTGAPGYGEAFGWERIKRTPGAAWHPHQPLLMVALEGGRVLRWTPAGVGELPGVPETAAYRDLAFSPDGRTLWASPSSRPSDDAWESSDVADLESGAVSAGPRWDTGIVEHPGGGGLVFTFQSDQGRTLGRFARVDQGRLRFLRSALALDADGYEAPVFSVDGRHCAIRGNAYENAVEVFDMPSLRRVLRVMLSPPSPGYPYPEDWMAERDSWSWHNIAFGARPGVLWVGTPAGKLVEIGLEDDSATEHVVPAGSPVTAVSAGSPVTAVTALAATARGELVVAGADLRLLSVSGEPPREQSVSAAVAKSFVDGTTEVTEYSEDLVMTDGVQTWEPTELDGVTAAADSDPMWLRLQAAVNTALGETRDGQA